jgi:hypothetical protein
MNRQRGGISNQNEPLVQEEREELAKCHDLPNSVVPNRSEAECRLKWTSTTPVWTPEEDMLLAMAVRACGKGVWLQFAAMVPGRTMLDCLNRSTLLVAASWTSIDRLPRMSGGIKNPVGAKTCCEEVR